ncbi:MAG: metallophosphoesterase [Luteolibacter sp.]|uniref:metallophosphoesterase family protein n=1 Tax=Luteolibacter sp. TaxID=1962973 RepID=UPI00326335DD
MEKTRRNFIVGTGSALLGGMLNRVSADSAPATQPPDISALLQAKGFNANSPGSALLAIVADVHINLDQSSPTYTTQLDDRLVNELNGLTPAITDLTIAGDLIVHNSVSIGGSRYPSHYALSRLEFRCITQQIQRFRSGMKIRAIPGNHDTDKDEMDADLWREELALPPYQLATLGGVPVFHLNSANGGMPDPAQIAWFNTLAATIPSDQEVLIIAHHPSFYYLFGEPGIKRLVSKVFANHRAPVWLVGGHGHGFAEQLFVNPQGTRFIQMEVTTGNPKQWSDNRPPGYVLIALQGGRVLFRAFRSVIETGFEIKKPVEQLKVYPLAWPFDVIESPAVICEEGLYERPGNLIDVDGIDLRSHFVACRKYTVRTDLSRSEGKITEFLLSAEIATAYVPPTCYFSHTGLAGSWVAVSLPPSNFQQIYRIPIPAQFRSSPTLQIKTLTDLQGPYDGITIFGWGLGADPAKLTGYDKWLFRQYRTILRGNLTDPTVKVEGSQFTNLEHYAFNLPLPLSSAAANAAASPISGTPSYSQTFRKVMDFRFARRTASSLPAVSYVAEYSNDLVHWTAANESQLAITPIDSGWEEARLLLPTPGSGSLYCRARVTTPGDPAASVHLAPGDADANGINDILQYAFDLQSNDGGVQPYSPGRKPGIPIQSSFNARMSRIVYPRMRSSSLTDINYRIEQTRDLKTWEKVQPSVCAETILLSTGDWEQVEVVILDSAYQQRFYRICLDLDKTPNS